MKKLLLILTFTLIASFAVSAQEKMEGAKPTEKDKTEAIPSDSYLKRGEPIGNSKKVSLNKILKNPAKYAGKTVLVEGVVVRSCKSEGCWAEVAENMEGKSVRVKMKDHSFFIPLQSAGSATRMEGVVSVKTLSKKEVDHLMKDDGAKFENINADGSVTEVSFDATGIELKKATK